MEEHDDDDLKAQRASSYALARIRKEMAAFVSNGLSMTKTKSLKYDQKQKGHLKQVVELLDYLQEEPQLLDPHLKAILPPLVEAFIDLVSDERGENITSSMLQDLAEAFYTLCKVRGEKVVVRFLSNEARYIQPMLESFARVSRPAHLIEDAPTVDTSSWQLRYILLLWLGHLMLTPFDLASISSENTYPASSVDIVLPEETSSLAKQVIAVSLEYLSSPTKEQSSAATILVKLGSRPDMQKTGVLDALVSWSFSQLGPRNSRGSTVHSYNGVFLFLNGLVRSANLDDISHFLPKLFVVVNDIFHSTSDLFASLRDSAVSKKLSIKIQRNVVVQLLQVNARSSPSAQSTARQMLEDQSVLEEVIDFFLISLADRDTQVRYAASKALSVVTAKLERELREEVVEAVLGSLQEDVHMIGKGSNMHRDVSAVSAVRWHGLTLTLAHMLFRNSPSSEQLPSVLEALYSSLAFEQRSTAGNSLGVNVRDAANFGLWSLARRYSSAALLLVEASTPGSGSALQTTATHLLVTSCIDPSGNVRRGSSAALQELIGRHPDTIDQGIAVVQTVDYHGVGLRQRAMIGVALAAASLSNFYLTALWDGLLGWRGLQAPDKESRIFAATSLGSLCHLLPIAHLQRHVEQLMELLKTLPRREVDWRHGLTMALSSILSSQQSNSPETANTGSTALLDPTQFWNMFGDALALPQRELSLASMRPDLTTSSLMHLISTVGGLANNSNAKTPPSSSTLETLTTCLKTTDPSTLSLVPPACQVIGLLLDPTDRQQLANAWMEELRITIKTSRRAGFMVGLAALASGDRQAHGTDSDQTSDLKQNIRDVLIDIYNTYDVSARVMALRSILVLYQTQTSPDPQVFRILEAGLNDYTINERGDVGSLVRIEAILTFRGLAKQHTGEPTAALQACHLATQRLSLERLDKVRLEAAGLLDPSDPSSKPGISTHTYFVARCVSLLCTSEEALLHAFWTGISSSAGLGSDLLLQTARSALYTVLSALPISSPMEQPPSLLKVLNNLSSLLSASLNNDRVLLPLLETISFLLDAGIFSLLYIDRSSLPAESSRFKELTLLSLAQKAHYKSTSLPKLLVCVQIYRGLYVMSLPPALASTRAFRTQVMKKLVSMLGHPFPKVRMAVAEVMFVLVSEGNGLVAERLKGVDWAGEEDKVRRKNVMSIAEALDF